MAGGNGGLNIYVGYGEGGTGYSGQAGGRGLYNVGKHGAAGGGGGAAGGGRGGAGGLLNGNASSSGGAGGTAAHKDGYAGAAASGQYGAGGGGGGFNGYVGAGAVIIIASAGGHGGAGGGAVLGGGGGGGAGGYGAVATGSRVESVAPLTGGAGGNGGAVQGRFTGTYYPNLGGYGGDGGVGLFATAAGVSVVVDAPSLITGGKGGAGAKYNGRYQYFPPVGANGGAGVAFRSSGSYSSPAGSSSLSNTGVITGGAGGAGGYFGYGGKGGDGVALKQAGTATNAGVATGGAGGNAFYAGNGGSGAYFAGSGSSLTNNARATINGGVGGTNGGTGGAGVTFVGSGTVTNAGTIRGGNGGSGILSYGGVGVALSGGGSTVTNQSTGLIKGGDGQGTGGTGLAFSGSGGIVINAGTIVGGYGGYGNPGSVGISGAGLTIVNTGSIVGSVNADAVTFTGGANTVALGTNASFTGALDIESGTLTFDQSAGAVANVPANVTLATTVIGAGKVIKAGAGTLTLTAANTYSGGIEIEAGVIAVASDRNLGAAAAGLALGGNGTLETTAAFNSARAIALIGGNGVVQVDTGTMTLTGVISGSGTFAKTGAGTLILSATETYTGGTKINAGNLSVSSDGNLGAAASGLTFGGGTLETTATFSSARTIALTTATDTIQVDTGRTTLAGVISGQTFAQLNKTGAGILVLSGANVFSGNLLVKAGTLAVSAADNLGGGGYLFLADGMLETTASFTTGKNIILNAAGTVQVDAETTLSGVISGAYALTETGKGTLTLSGANTYSGGTVLSEGTVAVSADANLGDMSGALTFAGGTLETTASFASGRAMTLNSTATIQVDVGTFALSGTVTGAKGFVKTGAGTLAVSGVNSTYTGGTVIQSGILEIDALGATGKGPAGTGAISFKAVTGGTAILALDNDALPASGGTFATTLDSFGNGDGLDLLDMSYDPLSTIVTYNAGAHLLSVTSGTGANARTETFKLTNEKPTGPTKTFYAHADASGTGTLIDNNVVACYCAGTLIRTPRGDVAVEALVIGDLVVTASGPARPIKWIGRRTYGGRFAMGQAHILPVCIQAGALGDGTPTRDLWISPQHAMYLDGVLIEAKDLLNGVSIVQARSIDQVAYFHVELDTHDVIVAEGALSETFIDDDSRAIFHNVADYERLYPHADTALQRYYAPRLDAGPALEAVRERIGVAVAAIRKAG